MTESEIQKKLEYLISISKKIDNIEKKDVMKDIQFKYHLVSNVANLSFTIRIGSFFVEKDKNICKLNESNSLLFNNKILLRIDFDSFHKNPSFKKFSKTSPLYKMNNEFSNILLDLMKKYDNKNFLKTEYHFHIFIYDKKLKYFDKWAFPLFELEKLFKEKKFNDMIFENCIEVLNYRIKKSAMICNIESEDIDFELNQDVITLKNKFECLKGQKLC